jgi:hypothetical protein
MRPVAGIVLLLVGVGFPMGLIFWLNGRMQRKPGLTARQVGLLLAFNIFLPVGLIIVGLGLVSAEIWAVEVLRIVAVASLLAAGVSLAWLWWASRGNPEDGGADGG